MMKMDVEEGRLAPRERAARLFPVFGGARPMLLSRWRVRLGLAFILVVAFFAVADKVPPREPLARVAHPYAFNIIGWEVRTFARRGLEVLARLLRSERPSPEEQREQVLRYFSLGQDIAEVEKAMQRERAEPSGTARDPGRESWLANRLAAKEHERKILEDKVQGVLEEQVAQALRAEGLTTGPAQGLGVLFPPVAFEFHPPPNVLVVSPRERIFLERTFLLQADLTADQMEDTEAKATSLGWSALVEATAGFSAYPTVIPTSYSLEFTLSSIAHEWLHGYLFFRPLGRHYFDSPEMRTINETVADMVGGEIGQSILKLYGLEPSPKPKSQREGPTNGFEFAREMRETQLTVEDLLKAGRIQEAEAYMEERRQFLAQHGYLIRKLNQAYFAFHGTYADRPTAVSPIGGYLRTLRERSPSLGAFVTRVAGISSSEELFRLVRKNEE